MLNGLRRINNKRRRSRLICRLLITQDARILSSFSANRLRHVRSRTTRSVNARHVNRLNMMLFLDLLTNTNVVVLSIVSFARHLLVNERPLRSTSTDSSELILLRAVARVGRYSASSGRRRTRPRNRTPLAPLREVVLCALYQVRLIEVRHVCQGNRRLRHRQVSIVTLTISLRVRYEGCVRLLVRENGHVITTRLSTIVARLRHITLTLLRRLCAECCLILELRK